MSDPANMSGGRRATIDGPVERLLDGPGTLTLAELAAEAGCTETFAAEFWLSMGFPRPGSDERLFTALDADALRVWWRLAESAALSPSTLTSLLRAQSHTMDRLVLWQMEAFVEEYATRYRLDDTSARLLTLARADEMIDVLASQLSYAWRRQMASLLLHTNAEVGMRGREIDADAYPLLRTMGFVDMVAYTRRSSMMSSTQLADLVQWFELTSRDVISARGGRVVKTLGDAVLWITNDLEVGADIVCDLLEVLEAEPDVPPVRASLVRGRVVSRSGDIFGPSVNLASRLVDIVPRGQIFTDKVTAAQLRQSPAGARFTCEPVRKADLKGMGEVEAWRVRRMEKNKAMPLPQRDHRMRSHPVGPGSDAPSLPS